MARFVRTTPPTFVEVAGTTRIPNSRLPSPLPPFLFEVTAPEFLEVRTKGILYDSGQHRWEVQGSGPTRHLVEIPDIRRKAVFRGPDMLGGDVIVDLAVGATPPSNVRLVVLNDVGARDQNFNDLVTTTFNDGMRIDLQFASGLFIFSIPTDEPYSTVVERADLLALQNRLIVDIANDNFYRVRR